MKLDGRRESSNVEGALISAFMIPPIGIGGILVVGLITLLMGGNIGDVLNNVSNMGGLGGTQIEAGDETQFTAEEQELARFSKIILASTEDVWTAVFQKYGLGTYRNPTLVLYSWSTPTS